MQLAALVEVSYFDGTKEIAIRVQRDDGSLFDLPVSMNQAMQLINEMNLPQTKGKVAPPTARRPVQAASPSDPAPLDDEEESEDYIRLATTVDGVTGAEGDDRL